LDAKLLASQSDSSRSLVQFPAMVQDTSASPELYISYFQDSVRCGGWSLNEDIALDSDSTPAGCDYSNLRERTVIWAVDVPGIAPWHFVDRASQRTDATINRITSEPAKRHKLPLCDPSSTVVQVKIYQNSAGNLRPTDLVNFVGILTLEEEHYEVNESNEPSLLLPTLHVLFHKPLAKSIAPREYPMPNFTSSIRNALLNWLAEEALQGDLDAAEWVLLGCISSVQSRSPPMLPLSITISQFKNDTQDLVTPTLALALKEILSLSVYLPLSLERLNTQKFAPESVNEDLHGGFLQLPKGTVLLLSDKEVEEGQLSDKGMRNLAAIRDVAKQQTLRYEFPFSNFSFETDISIIMLTSGRTSAFCETYVTVPLNPTGASAQYKEKSTIKLPEPKMLSTFRDLISSARNGKTTISDDISKSIQADFVADRQRSGSISSDDLIRRMAIARVLALSYHKQEISDEIWSKAKALDERRMDRCNSES